MAATPKKAGGIGDAAVAKATGKTWSAWFALLDKAGARKKSHQEIVTILSAEHRISPWWQQMVTVGYEQERGLRQEHEKPEGFQISRSKTLAASPAPVFAAFADQKRRRQWLQDSDFTIRKATPGKSLRITWADGTSVEVMFYPKGANKTQVSVQHGKLANAKDAERMKAYWGEQLEKLAVFLD